MEPSKQTIKLNEAQLRQTVKKNIKNVLNEKIELPWQNDRDGYRSELTDDESYEWYKELFKFATRYNNRCGSSLSTDEVIEKITGGKFKTVNELLKAIQISDAWKKYAKDIISKYNNAEWCGTRPSINYDDKGRLQYKPSIENTNVKDESDPWNARPPHMNEPGHSLNIGNLIQWDEHDKDEKRQQRKDDANMKRALAAADKRPLNRKGSLNRGGDVKLNESTLRNIIKEGIKKVLKEEYLNDKNDMQSLVDVLLLAKQNNMTDYEVFIKGFKFLVHWNNNRQWFEGTMMCSPKSASTNHIYAETINGFIKRVEQAINNAMECYKDGGKY